MSITKSYNKHTDTYYAYDTTYVWDEKLQKKVQKKVCVGKYDPDTGNIIPNAKRGRPSKQTENKAMTSSIVKDSHAVSYEVANEISEIVSEMQQVRSSLNELSEKFQMLEQKLLALQSSVL